MTATMNHNRPRPTPRPPRHTPRGIALPALLVLLTAPAALADSPTTMTSCHPLDGNLKYSCSVMVRYQGKPLPDADIAQRADMPSMPLAHNIPPAKPAENPGKPGHYEFEIELEMHGQWLFTYDLSSPIRDRVQEKIRFAPGGGENAGHSGHTHTMQKGGE